MSKPRIAICGGGIAGLTLAIALYRYAPADAPFQVDIYEADAEVRTVGAGITVWPRTWSVMRHLGLYEELSRVAVQASAGSADDVPKPAFVARKADQPREGYHYCRVLAPSGSTTMHRGDMIDVFRKHLPPSCSLHTSKRLLRYTQTFDDANESSAITLHFADGTTAQADTFVGADGIHSPTRMQMYRDAHEDECTSSTRGTGSEGGEEVSFAGCKRCSGTIPTWTGVHSYRCLIPTQKLYALNPAHTTAGVGALLCYSGKGKHIITYQISGGQFLNFVALIRTPGAEGSTYSGKWVTEVPRKEIVSQLVDWEPEVQQMLECLDKPTRWAMHVVENLPSAVSGNVVLLGDADAYILGRLLADPRVSRAKVPAVLRIYESIRLAYANTISQRARDVWRMYEFDAPGYYDGSRTVHSDDATPHGEAADLDEEEKQELDRLGEAIQKMWEWQWTGDVDEQWVRAERELRAVIGGDSQ
ncbi:FAD/NAD-P-binding domain-containing protein [Earliella scabrosa]|nr:FAD/NAD-P-binding domain-containing protein [Earliella scabrosa]